MYTTVNQDGVLNNYPTVATIYYAEYPTVWEQRHYLLQGAAATLLVGLLILTSLAASSIG
jgi:hypothetical protein